MLAVVYSDPESFRAEWQDTLSKGGIFVETSVTLDLRSRVEVGIRLSFSERFVVLAGEVVHCVPLELAKAGAVPGVAVQFDKSMKELRGIFEAWLDELPKLDASGAISSAESVARERRVAPRDPARVQARVCNAKGEQTQGLTRNISVSGILFSVSGEPLPIGERVSVTLTNSVSGEALEIPSQVTRHVAGEAGEVPALGIRFRPDARSISNTREFLKRLRTTEHSRRLGGISGDLVEMGLPHLMESFSQSCREGTITLMRENQEGYVAFSGANLVGCRVGRVTGIKALGRLLAWTSGCFEFHARIEDELNREPPISLESALIDAMGQFDEIRADAASRFDPRDRFRTVPRVVAGLVGDLSKLECAILELLDVGANVRKLLDVIPESDVKINEALAILVESGAIQPNL